MKRFSILSFSLIALGALSLSHPLQAAEASNQKTVQSDAKDEKPVGGHSGQKGGIYVVGRGFKTAGGEMEKGFKTAGHGIVKGGKATGHAFKKAGGAIHDFFTGESGNNKKK